MKISVYITSYNQKEFLKEAINSVLNQTLMPFEIIIVDDCSTDGSQELIREYAETYKNLRYIFHQKNEGVSKVRITALNNVKGDYVTYLDGDDIYLPKKLEIESQLIIENKSDVVFSNNMYVNPNNLNDVKWIWASNLIKIESNTNMFIKTITRDFPRQSLFRMELVNYNLMKTIGFHDPNLKIYEDYDLRIRLAKKAKFSYSLEPTTKIRISENGLSNSPKTDHLDAYQYIFNKYAADIEELNIELKERVKKKLEILILNFNTHKESTIFNKIVSFIKKMK